MLLFGPAGSPGSRVRRAVSGRGGCAAEASSPSPLLARAGLRASARPRLLCAATGEGRSYTSRGGRGGGGGEQPPRPRRVDAGEPRPAPPQAAGAVDPRLLTSRLKNAETGEGLLGLCDAHAAQFNFIHVSAALSVLAKKDPVERWKEDGRTLRLVALAGDQLGAMGGRQLANSLWAIAKLGLPQPDWTDAWLRASRGKMGQMDPQELSNSVYALSLFPFTPGSEWMDAFWQASLAVLRADSEAARFDPQGLSNSVYALAKLGLVPPIEWFPAFYSASLLQISRMSPQQLANTLWACATLKVEPTPTWMAVFWSSSLHLLAGFNSQALANTLWACAKLRLRPDDDWLARFLKASLAALPGFTSQALANMIWALAELNVSVGPEWMAAWSARAAASLDTFNEQVILNSLWALAVQQAYDSPLLEPLWTRAQLLLSRGSKAVDHHNFYCVFLAAAAEAGLLAPPRVDLLAAAQEAWQAQGASDALQRSSVHHAAVLQSLDSLKLDHESEHLCAKSERRIDIALLGQRVAIEIDGPWHFFQGTQERTGATLFRDRLLRAAGWRVVSLPWFELSPLVRPLDREARSPEELKQLADYLSAKLQL